MEVSKVVDSSKNEVSKAAGSSKVGVKRQWNAARWRSVRLWETKRKTQECKGYQADREAEGRSEATVSEAKFNKVVGSSEAVGSEAVGKWSVE